MSNTAFGVALFMVLGIGAAVAIPNMMGPRCTGGNETAAIATLRNLTSAQVQFQAAGHADVDGDGVGEFGTFGEMTGADGVRSDSTASKRGERMGATILSMALAAVDANGVVTKSGQAFRIYLPGPRGTVAHEGKAGWTTGGPGSPGGCCGRPAVPAAPVVEHPGSSFTSPVDADAAERAWCAYAWPVAAGNSGQRVFFVDQGGDVWQTPNKPGRYSGVLGGPAWDAAMPADGKAGWSTVPDVEEYRGRDGNLWKRTN